MQLLAPIRTARYLYIGAIVALLAFGFGVRTWGVLIGTLDLWADEAFWAQLLETRSLYELSFRPVGYMWLCRQLSELGDPTLMLRLPSYLAGVGALVFIYRSSALLFTSRTAVLFVVLLAVVHPSLVVFSKEFKPYSTEVFVYSALIYWAVICLRRGRASTGFWCAAAVSLPFSYPVVFLYPALALAFHGERLAILRRFPLRHVAIAVLVAVPLLFLLHVQLIELLDGTSNRFYWGSKYDVFPIDTGFLGGLAWYAQKTWALMTFPGAIDTVPGYAKFLFGIAYAGGAAILWIRRRFRELGLLFTPLVVVALANLLGYWPYGAFRTNLFLLPCGLLLIGHAVDALAVSRKWRFVGYSAFATVLVAAGLVSPSSYRTKAASHGAPSPQLTEVLDAISHRRQENPGVFHDVILADWHSWSPISYYLRDYPDLRDQVRLVRGPLADLDRLESLVAMEIGRASREVRHTRLWIVVTRLSPHRAIGHSTVVDGLVVYRREFARHDRDYHPLLVELRPRPAAAGPG